MLRFARGFSQSSLVRAGPPARGKAQGFAKKVSTNKTATKKVSAGAMYKNWRDTVSTMKFNQYAIPLELPIYSPAEKIDSAVGKVMSYSNAHYKSLYHMGSFKKNQFNELFQKPVSLIRESSTKKLIELIKTSKDRKLVLTGEAGVGKSTLLAQAHAYAVDSKYVVINISYPDELLTGRNDFFYDESLKEYVQPMYLKKFLRKILKSNDANILKSIPLSNDYKFPSANAKDLNLKKSLNFTKGKNSVYDLLTLKTISQHRGHQFAALITELTLQTNVPLLLSVDNFSRLITTSFTAYKNTENRNIKTLDFQIPKFIMNSISKPDLIKNEQSIVLVATSGEDRTNRTLPVGLGKEDENSYLKRKHYDQEFSKLMKEGNLKEFAVPKLTKMEVSQLLAFYKNSSILLDRHIDSKTMEQLADEKYFVTGNGNPRELIKSIVLSYN